MWQERIYPELTLVESEVERTAAYKAARKRVAHSWREWVASALVIGLIPLVGLPITHSRVVHALPVPHWLISAMVPMLLFSVSIWVVETAFGNYISRLYQNDGSSFATVASGMTPVFSGSIEWGDYDSDGDLDLVWVGLDQSFSPRSFIYRNNGGGSFTDSGASLIDVNQGTAST